MKNGIRSLFIIRSLILLRLLLQSKNIILSHVHGFSFTKPWIPMQECSLQNPYLFNPYLYTKTRFQQQRTRLYMRSEIMMHPIEAADDDEQQDVIRESNTKSQKNKETIRNIVESAILESGASRSNIQSIDFLPGKLIITMDGSSSFLSSPEEEDDDPEAVKEDENDTTWIDLLDNDDDEIQYTLDDIENDPDDIQDPYTETIISQDIDFTGTDDDDDDDDDSMEKGLSIVEADITKPLENSIQVDDNRNKDDTHRTMVDIGIIAKAINTALEAGGEGSLGYDFALQNEIEVTTPGASDILTGIMFESYRGFDVQVILNDETIEDSKSALKKKKKKQSNILEGKLIEKTNQYVAVNQKGRIKRIQNEMIAYVRLPKSKKER